MTRPYRRRAYVCPVERCGQSFHFEDVDAARTHMSAPHIVCSCGWVGVRIKAHLAQMSAGQACEMHHRTAVVRAKAERLRAVMEPPASGGATNHSTAAPKRRTAKKEQQAWPPRATIDEAWDVFLRLSTVDSGIFAHELAEWLRDNDPMPRSWAS